MDEDSRISLANTTPEVTPEVSYRDDHRHRVGVYSGYKARCDMMANHIHRVVESMPDGRAKVMLLGWHHAMKNCRNYLTFRDYTTLGVVRQDGVRVSCQLPFLCPLCAKARARRMVESYYAKTLEIVRQNPGVHVYHVTLTVKDGEDLQGRTDHLTRSFDVLKDRGRDARRGQAYAHGSQFESVLGGVVAIEIKRGSGSGLHHPHIHAIIVSVHPVHEYQLSDEWKKITGDSFEVNISTIDTKNKKGFIEVLKYPVKFNEMNLDDNLHAAITMKGKKMLRPFGVFIGCKPDMNCDLESTVVEDGPYQLLSYRYIGKGQGYRLQNSEGTTIIPHRRLILVKQATDTRELPY